MKFNVQEISDNYMRFVVTDVNPSFVNTIRRVLIANVPKMAIEDVEFHLGPIRDSSGKEFESISPLFDEIIAHRLGLIPVPTDLGLYKFRDECECKGEGCPNCTIMYNLNKKGPCTVYSGDLEPLGDSKFRISEDLIPIVKLDENQALLIYATAELGTAKKHAKWQPTSGIGYKYYPKIDINDKMLKNKTELIQKVIDICPRNILEVKNKKLVVNDMEKCIMCNSCEELYRAEEGLKNDEESAIQITSDPMKFIFKFETDGSMNAKDAFEYSLKFIEEKFNDFRDQVSKLK